MRPRDQTVAQEIEDKLQRFHNNQHPLPGIQSLPYRQSFIEQVVESIRRIQFVSVIRQRKLNAHRADPTSALFDPIRAAVLCHIDGQIDEAFWLVFLSVHFGKHKSDGWRLAQDIYGGMPENIPWDWERVSSSPNGFRQWLDGLQDILRNDGVSRRFGNHRKYESLSGSAATGTGAVVESYVNWINTYGSHEGLINNTKQQVGNNPRDMFDHLFRSMAMVVRFGRTGKFDYLTMVGKLGLAPIEPGSTYMQGATGPLMGARLLFGGSTTARLARAELDGLLVQLEAELQVGMQVLEDALCNWQKSPEEFRPYRG